MKVTKKVNMKTYQVTLKVSSECYKSGFIRGIVRAENESIAKDRVFAHLVPDIERDLPKGHDGVFEVTKIKRLYDNFIIY